jgi:hypothetical protein
MPNSQAICTSFKQELLTGTHALAADTIKAALYLATATVNGSTTAYSATGEATGAGYTAGGIAVTTANAPSSSGTTAFWTPSASAVFTTITIAATDCVLFYNSSKADRAISAHTFSSQTVTAGTLTLTMPVNNATTGLLRIA